MKSDVIVLGGGLAGLACATALAERGARATVLEKRPHLGGRAYSFLDPRVAETVDNGQHLFAGCYRETLRFLDRLQTRHLLRFGDRVRVEFADAAGRQDVLDCPPLPAPLNLAAGVLRLGGLGWGDKAGLVRLGASLMGMRGGPPPAALERLTVREWFGSLGLSRRLQERLLDPLAVSALNELPDRASALGLAQVLGLMFLGDAAGGRLGAPSVGLSDLYAEQARTYVESSGGSVVTGAKATAIELGAGGVEVSTEQAGRYQAQALVSALPPQALAGLARPGALRGGWENLSFSPIIGINLWLNCPVLDGPFVGLLGTELHWAFNKDLLWGRKSQGQYLSLVISGAHAHAGSSPAELLEVARRDLHRCLPRFGGAVIRRWTVVKEPAATLSPVPGCEALRPAHATGDPRLWLAGDWTRTGLPATIESAVASGHACARVLAGAPAAPA